MQEPVRQKMNGPSESLFEFGFHVGINGVQHLSLILKNHSIHTACVYVSMPRPKLDFLSHANFSCRLHSSSLVAIWCDPENHSCTDHLPVIAVSVNKAISIWFRNRFQTDHAHINDFREPNMEALSYPSAVGFRGLAPTLDEFTGKPSRAFHG